MGVEMLPFVVLIKFCKSTWTGSLQLRHTQEPEKPIGHPIVYVFTTDYNKSNLNFSRIQNGDPFE